MAGDYFGRIKGALELDVKLSGDASRVYRIRPVPPSRELTEAHQRFLETVKKRRQQRTELDSEKQ